MGWSDLIKLTVARQRPKPGLPSAPGCGSCGVREEGNARKRQRFGVEGARKKKSPSSSSGHKQPKLQQSGRCKSSELHRSGSGPHLAQQEQLVSAPTSTTSAARAAAARLAQRLHCGGAPLALPPRLQRVRLCICGAWVGGDVGGCVAMRSRGAVQRKSKSSGRAVEVEAGTQSGDPYVIGLPKTCA